MSHKWKLNCEIHLQISPLSQKIPRGKRVERAKGTKAPVLVPLVLYVSFPKSIAHRQTLHQIRLSHPAGEVTDDIGNSWLAIKAEPFQKKFSFAYEAILETYTLGYSFSAFPHNIPSSQRFLRAEKGIEISPAIQRLAQKISASSPPEIVRQSIEIVRQTLTYRLQKKEYGAQHAVLKKEGDCTEYASLLAALLRVKGVGSRITVGYLGDEELHAITEAYLGGVWIPIDVTNILEPYLGVDHRFVSLLRANWMLPGGSEKILTFYYKSNPDWHAKINSKTRLVPYSPPKVKIIGEEEKQKHGYFLPTREAMTKISLQITKGKQECQVDIENTRSIALRGTLLLLRREWAYRAIPLDLAPCEKHTFFYESSLTSNKSKGWRWVFLDRSERVIAQAEV